MDETPTETKIAGGKSPETVQDVFALLADREPAFPFVIPPTGGNGTILCYGATIRDWFAGMALQGLLASEDKSGDTELASDSYRLADAMRAERAKAKP